MTWHELQLPCAADEAGALEATLEGAGAVAVSLDDAGDGPLFEPGPGEHPLWSQCRLTGLFEDARLAAAALERLRAEHGEPVAARAGLREVVERDWVCENQVAIPPTRFGRRLWVLPPGTPPPAPDAACVLLAPRLAFGTGAHETTALCLEWLDGQPLAGATVVDFGCGSGILAIAAAKLGAARVHALDHDPQALIAAGQNAAANGVGERVLCAREVPPGLAGAADAVVANILAGTLLGLAPVLAGLLRPGGTLALAGILDAQAAGVREAYEPWCEGFATAMRGGWTRLAARRRVAR